jgi:glycosyltransferase involved in cell wall biosynthesis
VNSVCIATYNGEQYIAQQLQSILVQIAPDDEVIISDDGSTDHTLDILRNFNDPRICIIHNNAHNLILNFENAILHAKGNIIFLSDQDDVWLKGKYQRCLKELETTDLVCTNSMLTDDKLNILNPDFFSIYHSGKGILKNIITSTYYGACMAFKRHIATRALPFPKTREIGHDLWLGLVAEMIGTVRFVPQPYLLYRRYDGTTTNTGNLLTRSNRPMLKKIWGRIVISYHVCKFKISLWKKTITK